MASTMLQKLSVSDLKRPTVRKFINKKQKLQGTAYDKRCQRKDETAVHCCDPALSVLVMLVSRNVFHVVSALQFIVCLYFLGLIVLCSQDNQ